MFSNTWVAGGGLGSTLASQLQNPARDAGGGEHYKALIALC